MWESILEGHVFFNLFSKSWSSGSKKSPTGPTEWTPKKPEFLTARSQLRGLLVRSHLIFDGQVLSFSHRGCHYALASTMRRCPMESLTVSCDTKWFFHDDVTHPFSDCIGPKWSFMLQNVLNKFPGLRIHLAFQPELGINQNKKTFRPVILSHTRVYSLYITWLQCQATEPETSKNELDQYWESCKGT